MVLTIILWIKSLPAKVIYMKIKKKKKPSEDGVPKARPVQLQWTVASKTDGQRGLLYDTLKPPTPSGWMKRWWRSRREKAESFLFLVWFVFCFSLLGCFGSGVVLAFVCLPACLLCCVFFHGGDCNRMGYGGTRRWIELGYMMRNTQRFNKEVLKKGKEKF